VFLTAEELNIALQQLRLKILTPTPLCTHHYHNKIELTQRHCATCGTTLRRHSNPKQASLS